jgi:hypothetical protein
VANVSDITVEAVSSGFTRIRSGSDVLAQLDGVNLSASQLQFETLGNAGSSSVSALNDPFRSGLRNQLLGGGVPTATVNALFA